MNNFKLTESDKKEMLRNLGSTFESPVPKLKNEDERKDILEKLAFPLNSLLNTNVKTSFQPFQSEKGDSIGNKRCSISTNYEPNKENFKADINFSQISKRKTESIFLKSNSISNSERNTKSMGSITSLNPSTTNTGNGPEPHKDLTFKKLLILALIILIAAFSFYSLRNNPDMVFTENKALYIEIARKLNNYEEVNIFQTKKLVEENFGLNRTNEIFSKLENTLKSQFPDLEELMSWKGKIWKRKS